VKLRALLHSRSAAAACAAVVLVACAGCHRHTAENDSDDDDAVAEHAAPGPSGNESARPGESPRQHKVQARNVYASWYDVPAISLAARRAGLGELTAAHNRLPLGTHVRVTNIANGKSVVVRITDRGIPRGKPPLDLCRRAAEELDIVREGKAKVRMEVLPDDDALGSAPPQSPSPQP
jgi:rare lipoprotein A (peptidoglycan hydrolase)